MYCWPTISSVLIAINEKYLKRRLFGFMDEQSPFSHDREIKTLNQCAKILKKRFDVCLLVDLWRVFQHCVLDNQLLMHYLLSISFWWISFKIQLHTRELKAYTEMESNLPPVDLHWFFEISISAFILNWDKKSVIN